MKTILYAIIFLLSVTTVAAFAGQLIDGKEPLICATVEAISCVRGENCEKGLAEDLGAPQFMRIDFIKKEVIGPKRASPVLHMETDDALITLQGFELGMGWTMAIDRSTGNASITFASMDEAFVFFGACTKQ